MEIINILNNNELIKEFIYLCYLEWGPKKPRKEMNQYLNEKLNKIHNSDRVISILGLIDNNKMLGFISLLKQDGDECQEQTPWYATNYIKEEYRSKGYSKLLNDAIIKEATKLGFDRVYLKTSLINYYEKLGAKYLKTLSNGEKLYYIEINNKN